MKQNITLIECPRDAMQGWKENIPTLQKVRYLDSLLRVGFPVIDAGSFVSPQAIPQMADTANVLSQLDWENSASRLLAIVANERGAREAAAHPAVAILGFPFSISPTFQLRNTNSTIEIAFERVKAIRKICLDHSRELVVYISMGFGNPYGDAYNTEEVFKWMEALAALDIRIFSLADTVGLATPEEVFDLTAAAISRFSGLTIGVHLHSSPHNWKDKLQAALSAGCRRFDGAIGGYGGCPMAGDELVGNMNTQWMVDYFDREGFHTGLDQNAFQEANRIAQEVFV